MAISRRELLRATLGLSAGATLLGIDPAHALHSGAGHTGARQSGVGADAGTAAGSKLGTNHLHRATFIPFLTTKFRVYPQVASPAINMRLVDVTGHELAPTGAALNGAAADKDCFSLMFLGPKTAPLAQNTYTIAHPRIGRFWLFLVPIGCDRNGTRYQAIINRLHS
jgi:hypothetical protein